MPVKLNKNAFAHAKKLIADGIVVIDSRDFWSQHRPTRLKENEFIQKNGYAEYGKWHLGVDDSVAQNTKARYKFPYGNFEKVHRCGVLSIESRAGQYKYKDIQQAAAHLHGMLDTKKDAV